jgi:CRISPR-associated endonuclease Csn1
MSGIPIRGGLAKNDSMLRVDVYSKAGKFYLIPIYVHHQVTGMPNLAIVAHKPESDWILIDETYIFEFSLYSNDFVRIHLKNGVMEGYYSSCDRNSGSVDLWVHDRAKSVGRDGLQRGIGVKTARKIEKFSVDVLGRVFPLKTDEKRGLA